IRHRPSSRIYIGKTIRRFEIRWSQHRVLLRRGQHHCRQLQEDWNADGPSAFEFMIIETQRQIYDAAARSDLLRRERHWMAVFASYRLLYDQRSSQKEYDLCLD